MNLNLFEDRKITNRNVKNNVISKFLNELTETLKNTMNINRNKNNQNTELEEYNVYEKKKILLDNKSRNGNDLAWIMDDNSVCISEHGDGGPHFLFETNLPQNVKVGEVYEKIDGQYIYNSRITMEINKIQKNK